MYVNMLNQIDKMRGKLSDRINERAREVAALRGMSMVMNEGTRYQTSYHYRSYEREQMEAYKSNTSYAGVDYPLYYDKDTPTVVAIFEEWGGECPSRLNIEFPEGYLDDDDWVQQELTYVDRINNQRAAARKLELERQQDLKREQLARLKQELGED